MKGGRIVVEIGWVRKWWFIWGLKVEELLVWRVGSGVKVLKLLSS